MKSYKITVSGTVQGVGYRYFCYKKAVEYNLSGYAKNLYNGNVEVLVQGNKKMVKDFTKELLIGPEYASVKSVNTEEFDTENEYFGFAVY